jgi:hypothetical protein
MPDTLRETFDQLRQFLNWDITRLLEHKDAGNYAVAVQVAIGSEALSRLQDLNIGTVFVRMMARHGVERPMATDVFLALRNGLTHTYDTRYIKSGDVTIELIVSRGALKQAMVRRHPPGFVLNVETMWADLQVMFEDVGRALSAVGGALPEAWIQYKIHRGQDGGIAAWKRWLETAEEAGK